MYRKAQIFCSTVEPFSVCRPSVQLPGKLTISLQSVMELDFDKLLPCPGGPIAIAPKVYWNVSHLKLCPNGQKGRKPSVNGLKILGSIAGPFCPFYVIRKELEGLSDPWQLLDIGGSRRLVSFWVVLHNKYGLVTIHRTSAATID